MLAAGRGGRLLLSLAAFLVLPRACLGATWAPPLIICPASLAAGQSYFCFFSATGQGQAPARLFLVPSSGGNEIASAVPDAQNPSLYSLAVPSGTAAGQYMVTAPSTGGSSVVLMADVEVEAESALVLLEADRAFYKPGQKAHFRALVLSPGQLRPQGSRNVTFEVVSPEGFKLMSVVGITDSAGVASFKFPIADEPLLGAHTARVVLPGAGQGAGAQQEATFTVEEYVLPRFEVNLTVHQTYLMTNGGYSSRSAVSSSDIGAPSPSGSSPSGSVMTTLTGEISADFTFGEKVVGSVVLSVWAPLMSWEQSSESTDGSVQHRSVASQGNLELTLDGPVKFEIPVPSSSLQSLSGHALVVEASVTYAVTGERQSSSTSIPVQYQGSELQVDMKLADGLEVFRPGLPSFVRVELAKPDGKAPSSDELSEAGELRLVVQGSAVDYRSVDPDVYVLSPASFVGGALTVEVATKVEDASCCDTSAPRLTYDAYKKALGCCITALNMRVENQAAGVSYPSRLSAASGKSGAICASRAYSPQGEYLSVEPPTQTAPLSGSWTALLRSTLEFASSKVSSTVEYMIIQGGAVAGSGSVVLPAGSAKAGYWEAQLPVTMPATLSGDLRLVVIVRPTADSPALTASAEFSRGLQLPFVLSANFSEQEVKPGASLSVQIQAGPAVSTGLAPTAAHTFITSLDRSAELLGQRVAIGQSAILSALGKAGQSAAAPPVAPKPWLECGTYGNDVMVAAELPAGIQVVQPLTSSSSPVEVDDSPYGEELHPKCPRPIFSSTVCWGRGGGMMEGGKVAMAAAVPEAAGAAKSASAEDAAAATSSEAAAGSSSTVAVRKFFPETWLWTDLALLPGTGANAGTAVASLPVTAPDTITTWSLEAFATSSEGISAVRAELPLRVFKPFFVEVKLPYASVRGEDLELVFAVFNYVAGSGSLKATLDIELPPEIEVVDGSVSAVQLLVDESSATRSSLRIRPKSLGPWRIRATARATSSGAQLTDAVERPLLVRAEGFAVSRTENLVLDLSESRAASANVTLVLPESAVNGSARLTVAAVGDLLGPTISGLDRLLRIPTGCGEQNMIGLAPNVYVAKYLLAMGQLRPEIRQRVVSNIIVGYGRQLTYRHGDGSFSAFGSSDSSGSTWLTAFVLRVFAEVQGSGLVSVDSSVLAAAATWLVQLQNSDGSFKSMGNVIHTEMMGGAGSSIALTAFVASALAKAATEVPALAVSGLPQALQKAGAFLSGSQSLDTYSGLLRAHAMALSGLWTSLQVADAALAISSATPGRRFWTSSGDAATTTSSPAGYGRSGAKTLDVEMTGYGVLALTLAGKLSQAFEGAKWLLEKRSALGGFSSTQDTVVALNALATYATAVGRNVDLNLEIKETKDGGSFQETLTIDASNVDVLQSMALKPAPGDNSLEVKATGKGTALVIAELSYNLPKSVAEPCYDIAVEWFGTDDAYSAAVQGCTTPRQDCQSRVAGSMSIISIGLFTGYAASSSSLSALKAATVVKRYEISDGRVDLYLEEIKSSGKTCVQFNVTREFKVWNTQAAVSEIYEYYAPEARGENLASFSFKAMTSDVAELPGVSPAPQGGSTTKTPGGVFFPTKTPEPLAVNGTTASASTNLMTASVVALSMWAWHA